MNALRVVTFLRVVENDIIQDSILVNGISAQWAKNGKNGTEYKGILSNLYHYFPQVILKFGTLH